MRPLLFLVGDWYTGVLFNGGSGMKVAVYVPVADRKALEAEGKDPATWVRDLVKYALAKRRLAGS